MRHITSDPRHAGLNNTPAMARLGAWDTRMQVLREEARERATREPEAAPRAEASARQWPADVQHLRAYQRNTSALRAQDWRYDPRARAIRANRFYDEGAKVIEVVQEMRRRGELPRPELSIAERQAA